MTQKNTFTDGAVDFSLTVDLTGIDDLPPQSINFTVMDNVRPLTIDLTARDDSPPEMDPTGGDYLSHSNSDDDDENLSSSMDISTLSENDSQLNH